LFWVVLAVLCTCPSASSFSLCLRTARGMINQFVRCAFISKEHKTYRYW
jgi:hypothetical protein